MLQAYPNPERTGCPGVEKLQAMAAKTVPRHDPAWEHLWKCSPCFAEFVQFRNAQTARRRWRQILIWAPVAALLLITLTLGVERLLFRKTPASPQYDAAVFNFEGSPQGNVVRGESPNRGATNAKVQHLPAKKIALTIYLPRGSDEGEYAFEFLDTNEAVRDSATAHAVIDRGLTRFEIVMDLSKFQVGEYAVRSRRLPDGSWYTSTVIVE